VTEPSPPPTRILSITSSPEGTGGSATSTATELEQAAVIECMRAVFTWVARKSPEEVPVNTHEGGVNSKHSKGVNGEV